MIQIMFLLRTLCMKTDNVYKNIIWFRLEELINRGHGRLRMKSHVACMYEAIEYYGLSGKIASHIQSRNFGDIADWKKTVKNIVWKHEMIKWRSTCLLYNDLEIYIHSVTSIAIHPWWVLAKIYPHLMKYVSCLTSVLMSGQPMGIQRNLNSKICILCDEGAKDTPEHILFKCSSLDSIRSVLMQNIINEMPYAMKRDFLTLNSFRKLQFLLSGFNCKFTIEWINLYRRVLLWVQELYAQRSKIYDNIEGTP